MPEKEFFRLCCLSLFSISSLVCFLGVVDLVDGDSNTYHIIWINYFCDTWIRATYCIKYLESDQLHQQLECLRRVNIRANSRRDFQMRLKECKEHSRTKSAISSQQYPFFTFTAWATFLLHRLIPRLKLQWKAPSNSLNIYQGLCHT